MPLYFFLSGFFFKTYGGLWNFLRKKINKLLVPFAFFYLSLSVFLSIFLYKTFGIVLEKSLNFDLTTALMEFYARELFPNSAIWFLLCLFEINFLFYLVHVFTESINVKNRVLVLMFISFLIGFTGILLGRNDINLPMFIDSSMSALPFFMMGYIVNRHTHILHSDRIDKYIPMILIISTLLIFFLAGRVSYRTNLFVGKSCLTCYPCGFLGAMSIILISKKVGHLPLISYWGRYSIMILVSHQILYQLFAFLIAKIGLFSGLSVVFINLCLTMFSYLVLIPFMKKYLPYVTAQKDLI